MAENTEENNKLIKDVDKDVDKMNTKFEKANAKLKKMTENLRPPRKCCMDIVLIIILLVMLGILYTVTTKSYI